MIKVKSDPTIPHGEARLGDDKGNILGRIINMSADAQIKTGLKLSEAIKLLEENEGALFKPDELAD